MTQSKTLAKLATVLGAVVAALALLAPAASAAPNPGYEQFAGCPEEPTIALCNVAEINGGHFDMGNKEVPVENPIALSGGINVFGHFVYNSQGGLAKVPQKVPGGVVGLTGLTWLLEFFGSEALTLYATAELAGTPGAPILEDPFALPLKVHLTNPAGLLGNNCYVGSNSNPIELNLTLGTTEPPPPNEPISGKQPKFVPDFETGIIHLEDGSYVDNSFAAPGANGCKLVLFGFIPISINGLVNEVSGLPSAAGTNETVQEFDGELVEYEFVYE
jgi:hypothetical protein